MLFTSAPFLLYFLPLTVAVYHVASFFGRRAVLVWLVLASLIFYAYWDARFLFVLLVSLLFNFSVSKAISRTANDGRKRFWMVLGVVVNLGALCYFKYLFPLLHFLTAAGVSHTAWGDVLLPLGISFFTFTQIAYLVDLSQGEATPQNLLEYALFVTFFPHLIAGPILHHHEIMPQFSEERSYRLRPDDMLLGLSWFTLGLAKKSLFADRLALIADPLFHNASILTTQQAWMAVLSYSLQLYFDFSGYSDMALGLARMFSIRFPLNFNSPYKASSIIDFWARWHMTLTRYLTLYVYNPISLAVSRGRMATGKKVSRKAQKTLPGFASMIAWPTIATLLIAGVWHGAGSQFILFGLLHGLFITANHAWRNRAGHRADLPRWQHAASVLLTYLCVLVGQVFFRAASTQQAVTLLSIMTGLPHGIIPTQGSTLTVWLSILILYPVVWFFPNTQELLLQHNPGAYAGTFWNRFTYAPTWRWTASVALVFLVAMLFISDAATFLYFQF